MMKKTTNDNLPQHDVEENNTDISGDSNETIRNEKDIQQGEKSEKWVQVRRQKQVRRKRSSRHDSLPTLFVKGYPCGWHPLNLEWVFGCAGVVMDVIMPRDKSTGVFRGFALIRMSSEAELSRAVSMLHGQSFGGDKLLVQRARFGPERKVAKGDRSFRSERQPIQETFSTQHCLASYRDALVNHSFQKGVVNVHSYSASNGEKTKPPTEVKEAYKIRICAKRIAQSKKELQDSVVIITRDGVSIPQVKEWVNSVCCIRPAQFSIKPIGYNELWVKLTPGLNPDILKMAGALHNDETVRSVLSWDEFSIFEFEEVWILIWGIPLELWYDEFFIQVAKELGQLIELDQKTKQGEEMGVARMQIRRKKGIAALSLITVIIDDKEIPLPIQQEDKSSHYPRWGDLWRAREIHSDLCHGVEDDGTLVRYPRGVPNLSVAPLQPVCHGVEDDMWDDMWPLFFCKRLGKAA